MKALLVNYVMIAQSQLHMFQIPIEFYSGSSSSTDNSWSDDVISTSTSPESPLISSSLHTSCWSDSSQCFDIEVLSFLGAHVLKHLHFSFSSSFPSFLYLTRRFWNQILTCFSESWRYVAISILRRRDRYMLELNSRSSSRSCVLVKAVRIRLLLFKSSVELDTPVEKKS